MIKSFVVGKTLILTTEDIMFKLHDIDFLEISNRCIELEFCCGCGPWTPTGYCELDDLKNETGIDFPTGILLIIESEEYFNTDLVYEIYIEKLDEDGQLIISYQCDYPNHFNKSRNDKFVKELEKHFGCSDIQTDSSITRNMEVKENIYQTITSDLEIIKSIIKG